MKKWLTIVAIAVLAFIAITLAGCASMSLPLAILDAPKGVTPKVDMTKDTKAIFRVNCFLGEIDSVVVTTNGAGEFTLKLDKDECDGNDRT